jgi:hypothetical protein
LILSSATGEHGRTFLKESVAPFHRIGTQADLRLRFDVIAFRVSGSSSVNTPTLSSRSRFTPGISQPPFARMLGRPGRARE